MSSPVDTALAAWSARNTSIATVHTMAAFTAGFEAGHAAARNEARAVALDSLAAMFDLHMTARWQAMHDIAPEPEAT